MLITGTTKNINDLTVDISENVSSQASVITQQSASVSEITVITSYSIHYTKLYEIALLQGAHPCAGERDRRAVY